MAVQMPDGTTKKRKTKPKPKVERPEIVLVTPKPATNLRQTTELELFRAMIDGKPRVAMRVGANLLMWDGVGHPSTIPLPAPVETSFLDYLTDEEGVFIPGSADERVEPTLPEVDERPARQPPVPANMCELIPDGVSYVWGPLPPSGLKRDTYDARNVTQEDGRRFILLYDQYGHPTWTGIFNGGWGFHSFIGDDEDERWLKHNLRNKRMV